MLFIFVEKNPSVLIDLGKSVWSQLRNWLFHNFNTPTCSTKLKYKFRKQKLSIQYAWIPLVISSLAVWFYLLLAIRSEVIMEFNTKCRNHLKQMMNFLGLGMGSKWGLNKFPKFDGMVVWSWRMLLKCLVEMK